MKIRTTIAAFSVGILALNTGCHPGRHHPKIPAWLFLQSNGGSNGSGESGQCTAFTYTDWSACTNGTRTRSLLTSSPDGCTGGTPVLSESCGASVECSAPGGGGTKYHVGSGEAYTTIGDVPWFNLQPGDSVYIHPGTYHEKVLISTSGTPQQWICVRGVPDAEGNLPVISGENATTSTNMHWRWPDATGNSAIQYLGVVSISVGQGENARAPHYVEIAGLEIRDANPDFSFTTENQVTTSYTDFTACIYAKSPVHLLVHNNVLHNCGQGFYNWTGSGLSNDYWEALAADIVIRNNYFYDNGWPQTYTSHQTYTEADGVVIEGNRFGPPKNGMWGNQIKDRSAGTVVRYNYIEQSPSGYDIDLVEPQEGCLSLCYTHFPPPPDPPAIPPIPNPNRKYQQAFVYANIFVNKSDVGWANFIHWNEDHQAGQGRALEPEGRLFFYHNTIIDTSTSDIMFNQTWGSFDCPEADQPGRIDMRNNIVYSASGNYRFGDYCATRLPETPANGRFEFGVNWFSPTFSLVVRDSFGSDSIVSPPGNDPGFVNLNGDDYHLSISSNARNIGSALAPAVTNNELHTDLTPTRQYRLPHAMPTPETEVRTLSGPGSDVGAIQH